MCTERTSSAIIETTKIGMGIVPERTDASVAIDTDIGTTIVIAIGITIGTRGVGSTNYSINVEAKNDAIYQCKGV